MKLRIAIILFLIVTNHCVFSQSISDTIFNKVLLIKEKDVVKNSGDYLIDVVLNFEKLPVVLNYSKFSKHFFENRLFKNKPFILIMPDHEYYETILDDKNCCDMPLEVNLYYQRKYENNISKIDSLKVTGSQRKWVFTQSMKDLKSNDNIIFYYTERFGSVCCPKDPKWKMKGRLNEYIAAFEKANSIKLGKIYKKITGKEGEHILYFTLSNLSKKQKLNFLQKMRYFYFENPETKDVAVSFQVFSPNSIKKEGLKLIEQR